MIRHQLDVHVTNKTGGTALHLAAYSGHVSCVELLLQYGACVNTADTLNCTPLFGACERGHVEVVNILIRRKEDSCKFWHCVIRITLPIHFWSQKSGICYLRGFCGDVTSHENQEKLCSGEGLTLGTSAEIHQLPTALSVPLSTSIDIIQCFLCFLLSYRWSHCWFWRSEWQVSPPLGGTWRTLPDLSNPHKKWCPPWQERLPEVKYV